MSENDKQDETQPVRPDSAATPPAAGAIPTAPPVAEAAAAAPAEAPVARRGLRERFRTWRGSRGEGGRTFGLAALIASALAGVIVGGLGFAAVDAATGDDHGPGRDGWVQRDDDRGPGGRGGMHGGPRGVPGQLPPTTAPEDEDGSAS
ncbi:hypothetical protein IEZ26_01120 [Nocardioides cavernae]|uniref:Uncharacterized protein n=1 Tax=Nocardioides cavernae TaxID=1921566 RepID=A0ABR8N6K7_9ACTN|nr:hypothetical protein [Nocardioides cavernae]MBD3923206.1 hypothetical protein [Nocardioides cavernae]MBM7511873.1 hypothetical protein [Nocardioides cavernae]